MHMTKSYMNSSQSSFKEPPKFLFRLQWSFRAPWLRTHRLGIHTAKPSPGLRAPVSCCVISTAWDIFLLSSIFLVIRIHSPFLFCYYIAMFVLCFWFLSSLSSYFLSELSEKFTPKEKADYKQVAILIWTPSYISGGELCDVKAHILKWLSSLP